MLKWTALILILALLAGVAWLARQGETSGSAAGTVPRPTDPGATESAALLEDGDPNTRATLAPETRQLVPTAPVVPNPPAELPAEIQVLVLSKAGGAPVPGAEIVFLDRRTVADQAWQSEWYQGGDVEGFVERHGQRFLADGRGRVGVPRTTSGALVSATAGFDGMIDWIGVPQEPVRFDLLPKPDLAVLVVDGGGEPQSGVPVAVCLNTPEVPWYLVERRTNAVGIAEFTSLERVLQREAVQPGYAVGFAFPLQYRELIPIQPGALPSEALRLVLPPTGEVVVAVMDENGAPFSRSAQVALGRKKEGDGRTPFHTSAVGRLSRGRVHFPFVGVGARFDVRVQGIPERKLLESEHAGPALPGEVVEIELQWSELHAVLVGRAVTPDGQAMGDRRGRCMVEQEGVLSGGMQLQTDAAGGFRFIVTQPWREGARRSATFHLYPQPGVPSAESVLDLSRRLAPGDNVVGDVVFAPHPLVIEGRVRDADGQPVLGVLVSVSSKGPDNKETGEPTWLPGRDATASTDRDGRFSVYGELTDSELRLRAFRRGYLSVYEAFTPGATVEITLVPGEDPVPESTGPGRGDK